MTAVAVLLLRENVPTEATARAGAAKNPSADIDLLLTAQIAVAWAGESGEEAHLGWWKTDMSSEFGGWDLFMRLLPQTFDWAVVQAMREAARRHDARLRARVHDPDTVVSLFRLGFAIDERADERLMDLKRTGAAPGIALPDYGELVGVSWSRERFEAWVKEHGEPRFEAAPAGRQIKGSPPSALGDLVRHLVAALAPLPDQYPLPHYRRAR